MCLCGSGASRLDASFKAKEGVGAPGKRVEMPVARKRQSGTGKRPTKASVSVKKKCMTKSALIRRVIQQFETKLASNEVKATVGDFIRLLQLQQEMKDEQPREVKVKWVEEPAPEK